jgi:hypothetical protein
LEEEVSQLTSMQACDDAFLVPTSSRSTSKRSTPVSQLALTQDFDYVFLVPTSSRSASKRSTPVSQLVSMQTVDINTPVNHGSNPTVLTPFGRVVLLQLMALISLEATVLVIYQMNIQMRVHNWV